MLRGGLNSYNIKHPKQLNFLLAYLATYLPFSLSKWVMQTQPMTLSRILMQAFSIVAPVEVVLSAFASNHVKGGLGVTAYAAVLTTWGLEQVCPVTVPGPSF